MALQQIRIGNAENVFQYDDAAAAFTSGIDCTAPISAGSPVNARDVVTLSDLPTLANILSSSAIIADHSIVRGDGGARTLQDSSATIGDTGILTVVNDLILNPAAGDSELTFQEGGVFRGRLYYLDASTRMQLTGPDGIASIYISAAGRIQLSTNGGQDINLDSINDIVLESVGDVKIGNDGGVTDYANFASDGQLTLAGDARVTKEVKLNASSFAPGASGAAQTTVFGRYSGWAFTINDDMIATFEVPFDWDSTTDLTIKIYWYIDEAYVTNSGEVQWEVNWGAIPSDNTEAMDAPTHSGTIDYGDQDIPANAKYLTKTAAGTIAAASLSAGDLIGINVVRKVLDGGANPVAEPVMAHLEVEYTSDKLGEAI